MAVLGLITVPGLSLAAVSGSCSLVMVRGLLIAWAPGMEASVVVVHGLSSCSMWDLLSQPEIEPGPPALEAQSLSHWTMREVSLNSF